MKRETYLLLRIMSYISSIFPFLIFAFLKCRNNIYEVNFGWIIIILELMSILYIIYFYKIKIKRSANYNKNLARIKVIKEEKVNNLNWVIVNILLVLLMNINNNNTIIFTAVIVILLGIIYVKKNLIYINPLYDLVGIKVYNYSMEIYDFNKLYQRTLNCYVISNINLYNFSNKYYEVNIISDEIAIANKNYD